MWGWWWCGGVVVEGKQQIPGSPQFLICNFLGANKGQFEVDLHIVWWPDWYPPPPFRNIGSASE